MPYPAHAVLGFPGQFANSQQLTGAQHTYNRYRDYDVNTGRHIQADPIGLAGDDNPYAYAGGNPLRYMDPTGEVAWFIVGGFFVGAGSDLALQIAMNKLNGRNAFACISWTQVGLSGAAGMFLGGVGGAGFRTAANLSATFANVSKRVRRAEGLIGSGLDLHHWLIPRRFEKAFGGRAARIVNGRWNLNPIEHQLHMDIHSNPSLLARIWIGSPTWAKLTAGGGAALTGGGILGDLAGLNKDCSCGK